MLNAETIQTALAKAGFYHGEADGDFGPASRAARDAALEKELGSGSIAGWPHSRRMMAVSQWALKAAGFDPGAIDGLDGPATRAAEFAFRKPTGGKANLPWMEIAESHLGLHEVMDHDQLKAFLKSDGRSSGDPATVPWCGDFVSTCLALALPDVEQPENPFGARNWSTWGEDATGLYGAVISFWRGERRGWQGHVGFVTAIDVERGLVEVLGGNQGNEVKRAWLGKERILAMRAPPGWAAKMARLDKKASGKAKASTNEA